MSPALQNFLKSIKVGDFIIYELKQFPTITVSRCIQDDLKDIELLVFSDIISNDTLEPGWYFIDLFLEISSNSGWTNNGEDFKFIKKIKVTDLILYSYLPNKTKLYFDLLNQQ
jgi:hypothetical protein